MMATTGFKFMAGPISGGSMLGGKFVGNRCFLTGNRAVAADVDADTGRHVVSDPVTPDGAIGTRYIAGRRRGPPRRNVGSDGSATGIDVADLVTHSHDAVLLTFREAYKLRPENDCKTAAT
jgi:hypothetical protein